MWERLREDGSCLVLAIAVFCNLMLYPMPVKIVRQSLGCSGVRVMRFRGCFVVFETQLGTRS